MKKILCIPMVLSLMLLQGCVPIVIGGAAVAAGGAAYYKRNSLKTFYSDTTIGNEAVAAIKANPETNKDAHIVVAIKNGDILLAGQVVNASQRIKAEQMMQKFPGVRHVFNEITVSGITSELTRSSDTWITTKVKSELLAAKGVPSSKVKVVTENGVVYLMGNVDPQQGKLAADVARQIGGVQKVVMLFDDTGSTNNQQTA